MKNCFLLYKFFINTRFLQNSIVYRLSLLFKYHQFQDRGFSLKYLQIFPKKRTATVSTVQFRFSISLENKHKRSSWKNAEQSPGNRLVSLAVNLNSLSHSTKPLLRNVVKRGGAGRKLSIRLGKYVTHLYKFSQSPMHIEQIFPACGNQAFIMCVRLCVCVCVCGCVFCK